MTALFPIIASDDLSEEADRFLRRSLCLQEIIKSSMVMAHQWFSSLLIRALSALLFPDPEGCIMYYTFDSTLFGRKNTGTQ